MSDQQSSSTDTANQEPQGTDEGAQNETPTVEDLLAQVEEWKGHARKHEERAKANKDAAERLAAIEREQMTDAQRAEAERAEIDQRVSAAEERATTAEAALARLQIVHEFALGEDDTAALEGITDPETLRKIAERLSGRSTAQPPKPNPAQGNRHGAAPATKGDMFAQAVEGLF